MAETISGVGVVWGLGSTLTATDAASGIGTFLPQSADFDAEADNVEVPDYRGETVASIHYNQRELLRMEVIPTGATIALARAANIIPTPGAVITVVDTIDTEIAGATSTAYELIRAGKRKSNKDVTKLVFEMRRFKANNVTATVAAS